MTETLRHTIGSAGRLAILPRGDLEKLDAAALAVLAETGVAIPSARARAALVAQGATADGARVTFPPGLVRRLVAQAPARMTLGARGGAALVTGERSLLTTDGCCVEIYDLEAGEKRGTTADDVATISRVVDALARGRLLLAGGQRPGPAGRDAAACTSSTWPSPTPASTCRR